MKNGFDVLVSWERTVIWLFRSLVLVNTVHSCVHHRSKTGQAIVALRMLHYGHDDVLIPVFPVEDDPAIGMKLFPSA